jgi:RES domain-containing protein
MPSNIWTRCGGRSNARRLAGRAWRVVESQHLFSTRKLVASDEEQRLLEQLIEEVKPPSGAPPGMHWLLFTPFRYPPLRHGSRFGTRAERGIWYGSRTHATAFAEKAYYLLLLLAGTEADLTPLETDVSIFQAAFETTRGVDLTRGPFERYLALISSPTAYEESQVLGRDMRAEGVEAFLYASARDPKPGVNVGLFVPAALSSRRPSAPETWRCVATREGVEVAKEDVFRPASFAYPRRTFEVDGRLPAPAL